MVEYDIIRKLFLSIYLELKLQQWKFWNAVIFIKIIPMECLRSWVLHSNIKSRIALPRILYALKTALNSIRILDSNFALFCMLPWIFVILFHQHWNANIHNTSKCYGTKIIYQNNSTINNGTIPLKSCASYN